MEGRFHLTLATGGHTVMRGWWADEATARHKFRLWIGEHGTLTEARVTLVDEVEQRVLAVWPDDTGV